MIDYVDKIKIETDGNTVSYPFARQIKQNVWGDRYELHIDYASGNDNNTGLSRGAMLKTLQKAYEVFEMSGNQNVVFYIYNTSSSPVEYVVDNIRESANCNIHFEGMNDNISINFKRTDKVMVFYGAHYNFGSRANTYLNVTFTNVADSWTLGNSQHTYWDNSFVVADHTIFDTKVIYPSGTQYTADNEDVFSLGFGGCTGKFQNCVFRTPIRANICNLTFRSCLFYGYHNASEMCWFDNCTIEFYANKNDEPSNTSFPDERCNSFVTKGHAYTHIIDCRGGYMAIVDDGVCEGITVHGLGDIPPDGYNKGNIKGDAFRFVCCNNNIDNNCLSNMESSAVVSSTDGKAVHSLKCWTNSQFDYRTP